MNRLLHRSRLAVAFIAATFACGAWAQQSGTYSVKLLTPEAALTAAQAALAQCRKAGDLRNAVPGEAFVCGELADAVAGRVARTAGDEIVVFDSTGLAVGDLAICALLLRLRNEFPAPGAARANS